MPLFSWGAEDLLLDGKARSKYLKAIRAADQGVNEPLLQFARS